MGKDSKGKGKGKTCAKRVKGGKCSAEEQDLKESMDKPRAFVAFSKVFSSLIDKMEIFLSSLGGFFHFLYQGLFSAFQFFFRRSNPKEIPCGNFCQVQDVI